MYYCVAMVATGISVADAMAVVECFLAGLATREVLKGVLGGLLL